MTPDEPLRADVMGRLLRAAGAGLDDPAGQAELRRSARLLKLKLASDAATMRAREWRSVDPNHDAAEAEWREMGMAPAFDWGCIWSAGAIEPTAALVDLFLILRFLPQPNGAIVLPVPFKQVRQFAGFSFRMLGLVVPAPVAEGAWHAQPARGPGVWIQPLAVHVGIGELGELHQTLTPTGLVYTEGPFNPRRPDDKTLEHARRALGQANPAGRPPLDKDAARASRIEMSRKAWAIKQQQPTLGWSLIAPRVGAPSGETLRRWIVDERLHER
jgi:hypothetical protein